MYRIAARMAMAVVAAGISVGVHAQDIVVISNNVKVEDGALGSSLVPLTTFSDETIGNTAAIQMVIRNESNSAALSVTNITITGANPGDFTIADSSETDNISPQPLQDDGYIIIHFNPTALGLRTAQVNIFSNDPDDEGIYSFGVSGTGVTESTSNLPDLKADVSDPKVQVSKEGKVTVKGKVAVYNQGPVPIDSAVLEIYISDKSYLDDTARLVKIRQVKKLKSPFGDKTYRKSVGFKADGNGNNIGYILYVIKPVSPVTTDRNWTSNTGAYRYPSWQF